MTNFSKIAFTLGLGLAGLTGYAQTSMSIEDIEARARFIAEHPILSKIIQDDGRNNLLPLRSLSTTSPTNAPAFVGEYAPTLPDVWANMINSSAWTGRYAPYGIYQFRPGNPLTFNQLAKGAKSDIVGNGGAILLGDKYYVLNWESGLGQLDVTYTIYNAKTWERISKRESIDPNPLATDLAYDRLNNVIYGCFFRGNLSGYELGTVEFNNTYPTKSPIGNLPLMAVALGMNSKGELYGILEDGILYKIDTTDASLTKIGDTGIKVAGNGGIRQMTGEFDQNRDIFYWAANDIYNNWTIYTVDVTNGQVTEVVKTPDASQLINMQIMAPTAKEKAPAELQNFAVNFDKASTTGNVSFTVPQATYDGYALSGSITYKVSVDGKSGAQGSCTPGQKIETSVIASPGSRRIEAWLENNEGRSPVASTQLWVGYDVPVVNEVNLDVKDHTATVTWKTNEASAHGGYMDGAWYKVTRMPDKKVVAEKITEKKFVDEIPQDATLAQYSYQVTPCNEGIEGTSVASDSKLVGKPLELPYTQNFDSEYDFNLMTVVNANNDDCFWEYNRSKQEARIDLYDDYDTDFDDWIITPPIRIEGGKEYRLSFSVRSSEMYSRDRLEVKYGSSDDLSTFKSIIPLFMPNYLSLTNKSETFKADKDEVVRFGFHRLTQPLYGSMTLDNISIVEVASGNAPAAVSNLIVTPGEKGAYYANITFDTPEINKNGSPLESINKTEIYVDNVLSTTIDTPAKGTHYDTKVNIEKDGIHKISVIAHNEFGAGLASESTVYIGQDKPVVTSVKVIDNIDKVTVKWELGESGSRGYYVNPEDVTYTLYSPDSNGYFAPIQSDLSTTEYEIKYDTTSGEQGGLQVGIIAQNKVGQSNITVSNLLIVGEPYTLPYEEHFLNSEYNYEMKSTNFFGIAGGPSSDGDEKSIVWMAGFDRNANTRQFATLKISMLGNENPQLSFDYLPGGGTFEVYVMNSKQEETLIGTFNESNDGWSSARLNLSNWKDEPYIRLRWNMVAGENAGTMCVDNIKIQDVVAENLDVTMALANSEVPYGKSADIFATVTNRGSNTSGEYNVNFYVNDKLVDSQKDSGLEFTRTKDYHLALPITFDMPKTLNVKVEVDYPADERPANNVATSTINVLDPKVSAPENLAGEKTGNSLKLTWNAPSEFYSENVNEMFETYTPWTIFNIGDWKLVDVDKAPVITIGNGDYPNAGRRQSWTVFNPSSIGMTSEIVAGRPHSGGQYIACFTADVNETEHNDDWLISPVLTGNAQTISFYAKALFASSNPEKLQVLVSTTGRDIEDFEMVDEFEISETMKWDKYEVGLPEGALYFALRCVTRDGNVLFVDDIKYTAGSCHEIVTYRIYGDNIVIAETSETSFEHIGNHAVNYNVTAIYATEEESAYSNTYVNNSGITTIAADGVALYDIYNVNGMIICLKGESISALGPGIYVVNGIKVRIK